MKSRFFKTVLTAACALTPLAAIQTAPAVAQSIARPSQEIVLSIGRGELVTVPGQMADIFISNEAVADVQVKSQRQLYVFGKAGGETTLYASNAAGDIIWSANIRVGSNIGSIDQMLALAMPEAKISVATMGTNTVLLTGTVAAPEDAAEAERLVSAFVGEETNVVSRLKMATPLQVNLRVRIAEVSRTLARQLGGSLSTYDFSTGGFRGGIGSGRVIADGAYRLDGPIAVGNGVQQPTIIGGDVDPNTGALVNVTGPGVSTNGSGGTIAGMGRLLGLDLLGALDIAEREGLVTTLSQPNLTAISGETAEFLAGGEFPIPMSGGLGTTTIEYKNYGVSLAYTPTVLANGRISIRVRPEVSELSSQGAINVNGFSVPALVTRRAETSVELGSGQSFMIAGLLSNSAQSTIDKMPGAGDLPILGHLFKSSDFRKGQTELVIVVTPYLVKPVDDSQIMLPTDGYQSPTFMDQFLLNKNHDGISGASRPGPTAANGDAPPPAVSVVQDPVEPLADHRRNKSRQAEAQTAAVEEPGFSLK